ncbi:MAG: aminoacyl-tRNA hydrolase [Vannielia sp.]|uniref:alternative ribosome rescue aminoacyl-tRNA hydrolase ArfB n=1 Tax=Rhodobacterales TaxID=204455 RepID=UPI0020961F9A|nr:alternative ribosome rescue aminoacyl-tRNA hydrolase ArfB [Oceanicola sp. 502str15]MCO6383682.1 aminoacyl-tRNA hydrolase [Oceanicola sp. 502str15]
MPIKVNEQITIEDWEVSEVFTTSQGPGGQNVNKVATAVELRFAAANSPNLPPPVKSRLRRLAGRRWTEGGELLLLVQETRSQAQNREIARERLAELIRKACEKPKRRIATRPTLGSKKRRLKAKKVRGEVKAMRGKVDPDG